jgi:hypothetical protein
MKRVARATFLLLALGHAAHSSAQTPSAPPDQEPQFLAARKALPQPPPYGAYFAEDFRGLNGDMWDLANDAVARSYGYVDRIAAARACIPLMDQWVCKADPVAHRRNESPEIQRYGFANWKQAVQACSSNRSREFGRVSYCQFDPFLKLRGK